jgi:hypothetical protein
VVVSPRSDRYACLQLLTGLDSHRLMLSAAKSKNKHRFRGYLRDGTHTGRDTCNRYFFIAQNDLYILIYTSDYLYGFNYNKLVCCVYRERERERSKCSRQRRVPSSVMSYSPLKVTLVSLLAYFSTQRMEMACSSETSIDFERVQGIISQKAELFTTTAVITPNPPG